MKTLFALLLTSTLSLGMLSCISERPIVQVTPENNRDYRVDYLFEHDGCKVYRFRDSGHYVYFTNCTGDVTSIMNDSTKTRVETIVKSNVQRIP